MRIDSARLRLQRALGIDLPILQAPIGNASSPALVVAVSNAGGLGMLAGTWRDPAELRSCIAAIREKTGKSFAVNLGVHLAPAEKIELCLTERVPVISLFWGDARSHFDSIKRKGTKVIATVGTRQEAIAAAEAGADAIIAQGFEAGGHVWGKISGFCLIPEICESVSNVPIIAAGGIGDGRSMAAALALGASGVCLGTRFLVAEESFAHPVYQQCIINSSPADTVYGEIFQIGWPNAPHRVLRNSTVDIFERHAGHQAEIVAHGADGTPIPRFSSRLPTKSMTGAIESMALYAGESVGYCRKIQPARDIISEIVNDAR